MNLSKVADNDIPAHLIEEFENNELKLYFKCYKSSYISCAVNLCSKTEMRILLRRSCIFNPSADLFFEIIKETREDGYLEDMILKCNVEHGKVYKVVSIESQSFVDGYYDGDCDVDYKFVEVGEC